MKSGIKIVALLLGIFFSCLNITAQSVNKSSLQNKFHSCNSVQLLNGQLTTSVAIHSINGFQFGKFFTGIGVGFDYYYHTTVPLFMEGRYNIIGTKRKLQCFVNGGVHIPFSSMNKKLEYKTGSYKTGKLLAAGFDYFIPLKTDAMVVGIAWSQKQVKQLVENNVWNPVLNRIENIPIKDEYQLNRIWIKLGWVF